MKKGLSEILRAMLLIALCASLFAGCAPTRELPNPQKLSAPVVTLSDNIALWGANPDADRFEISINGNLSYVENSVTSRTLTDGQTFKIRAVGDGNTYATSEWSNSVTYVAQGPETPPAKLGTPNVTISDTGLASWGDVPNASGYIYKISGGNEVATAETSVQLTDGQSITVKAVGDGVNYTDGDYSASKTYAVSGSATAEAPTYLGIFASDSQPSESDGLPEAVVTRTVMASYGMMIDGSYSSFETLINEYFSDSENHLGTSFPEKSDYGVYSKAGENVYIQIWLNNPHQHTILSLKLNGTKYQVGGGLFSFFIEENGQRYNCIYVSVAVPNGSYDEISYTVTDIEYIADTYINEDGTDQFMNDNDTVKIGLPYNAAIPSVSNYSEILLTVNEYSSTFNLSDGGGLADKCGGWIGVALSDGDKILANKAAKIGINSFEKTGLEEGCIYGITVYLYADLHDGKGVYPHIILEKNFKTEKALIVDGISGALLYDAENDGYYSAISISTTLNSATAEYIKLEILGEKDEVILTDSNYNGEATVSNGISGGNSYTVRVYYKDTEYPEGKYVEEWVWTDYTGVPWYSEAGTYPLVNDVVHYFQLTNFDENYPIITDLTLKYYDEESARWVASDVLYLLDNPNAIEDLNAQIDALRDEFNAAYGNHELMNELHKQMSELEDRRAPLEYALWYLENRADNNRDKAYWQAEAAKGKYYYEIVYNGTETETIFKIGKTYYVVLEDALWLDGGNQYRNLKLDIDYGISGGERGSASEGVSIENLFICNLLELREIKVSGNEMSFYLVNIDDYMLPDGGESNYEKAFLYKIVAHVGTVDETVLYLNESNLKLNVDEEAWFAEYIRRVKAGESVEGLYDRFIPKYKDSYSIAIDGSKISAGIISLQIYTRCREKVYAEGEYEDVVYKDLFVKKQLERPTVVFDEYGGRGSAESSEGWETGYEYEAQTKNGLPVELEMIDSYNFALPPVGTMVRAKRLGSEFWLDSEWGEWVTFEGIKLPAPEFGEYDLVRCKIGWSIPYAPTYVSHYIYTVNGGSPITAGLEDGTKVFLKNGDLLRVRCVPNAEGVAKGYTDGEWAEYICVDNRLPLSAPKNLRIADKVLWWDAVGGAAYYVVEETRNGVTTERIVRSANMGPPIAGATYRVRALSSDQENYRASEWSESITY